jgi:hypothetical protein
MITVRLGVGPPAAARPGAGGALPAAAAAAVTVTVTGTDG